MKSGTSDPRGGLASWHILAATSISTLIPLLRPRRRSYTYQAIITNNNNANNENIDGNDDNKKILIIMITIMILTMVMTMTLILKIGMNPEPPAHYKRMPGAQVATWKFPKIKGVI